ncbi:hypothetical protein GCM10027452_00650 [Micromonospora halotolerans]
MHVAGGAVATVLLLAGIEPGGAVVHGAGVGVLGLSVSGVERGEESVTGG